MTAKLTNGDYTIGNNSKTLVSCDGAEALVQAAQVLLRTARGRFYPNKDFGSQIASITRAPKSAYLEAYARQALDALDGVYVKEAHFEGSIAEITLVVNDEERLVRMSFDSDL